MSAGARPELQPSRRPVQARSIVTVDAIREAGIQVLLRHGYAGFTTTRVAERAGVSVGTLYQYFPNKRALLATLLAAHLDAVVDAVAAAADRSQGATLADAVQALTAAFVRAKLHRAEISRALYAPMAEADGATLAAAAGTRAALATASMLASCANATIPEPVEAANAVTIALSALMQAALAASGPIDVTALERRLFAMAYGYLTLIATAPVSDPEPPPHQR